MRALERDDANLEVVQRFFAADPVLEDVRPAREAVPGYVDNLILTSGPTRPWQFYSGGQRNGIIGAALFEGLAESPADAIEKLACGTIQLAGCQDYRCVGSLAGLYSASMPVLVVHNRVHGNRAFCNFYEGTDRQRLNYGVYNEAVHKRLKYISEVIAPVLGAAVRRHGGVPLKPLMKRALNMGDELHSRNTAAALLFLREVMPAFLDLQPEWGDNVKRTLAAMTEDHYFFLRFAMAASKAIADAGHGVEGGSVVTAMAYNCGEFAIRVSGLGEQWFSGPHPRVEAKLFDGYGSKDIGWMGGESPITETIGLGGFAQACAFTLQDYQGGSPKAMVDRNLSLYGICVAENPDFRIPYLGFRGTPTGIDVMRVLSTGTMPVMDIGIAGKDGGQIGAGVVFAQRQCFEAARDAYLARYAPS